MIFINEAGQGPFVPTSFSPPQILCRLKGYIHPSSSFCCRGSRDVGHGIHGLSDDRSIIVSTADIDIILSSLRKNTKSREPSHSTRELSLSLSLSRSNVRTESKEDSPRILLDKIKFTMAVHVIHCSLLEKNAQGGKEGRVRERMELYFHSQS